MGDRQIEEMSTPEKNNYLMLVLSFFGFLTYVGILIGISVGRPVTEVNYLPVLLWVVGVSAVIGGIGAIAIRASVPKSERRGDVRDKEIDLLGNQVGNAFIVMAGMAAIVLAVIENSHYWIANTLFIGFLFASLISSAAKASAYHGEYPEV